VQFLARLVHFVLTDVLGHTPKTLVLLVSLANLDKGITLPRRVHRFFKEAKEAQQLSVALAKPMPQSLAWVLETTRLAAVLNYTLHDHATWLYAAQVWQDADGRAERVKFRGLYSFFFANLLATMLHVRQLVENYDSELALVTLVRQYKKQPTLNQQQHDKAVSELAALRTSRSALVTSLVKDVCDLHVSASMAELGPLRNRGYNRGLVALLGLVAAAISIRETWTKLT